MNPLNKIIVLTTMVLIFVGTVSGQELKMNQVQVIGSHNSYKIGIEKPLMDLIVESEPEAIGLDYAHVPITEQLDLGLRSLEIDVLFDPNGGQFSHPKGLEMLQANGVQPKPFDEEAMKEPGFKVLHVPDIDFRSYCATFKACLSDVKTWSMAHPDHLPIIITLNPKTSGLDKPGFAKVLPFSKTVLDALDKEILGVFKAEELITPKQVKGKEKTLRQAVVYKGWPALKAARGKILFVFDAGKELTGLYVNDDERYARPMFPNVDAQHPHAAFLIMNEPSKQENNIAQFVKQGYMVRTRSDADTREARTADKTRFEAAMRSGAQVITTDYYLKSLSPNKDFEISFQGKYSRCNPINTTSTGCDLD